MKVEAHCGHPMARAGDKAPRGAVVLDGPYHRARRWLRVVTVPGPNVPLIVKAWRAVVRRP